MNIQLLKSAQQHTVVIQNLMQFYMYDFSGFVELDVEANGLFAAYKNLDDYWKDENKCAYIMQKNEKYVGFALVRLIETAQGNYYSIAEFFVLKKYRKAGIGKSIAIQIFNLHKGQWKVFQKESNKPAQLFWSNVIAEYTKGVFIESFKDGRVIQELVS